MSWENVTMEIKDGIATVTINRPKQLNALNVATIKDLSDVFDEIKKNDEIKGILLTGSGDKAFVAGADIAQMRNFGVREARDFAERGQTTFSKIEDLPKPVIAVVNGYALGGGLELAMSCDIIIASEKARFGQPEVKLGVIPGFGGTQRLVRRVGMHLAKELIFSGEMITAERAAAMNLVNTVYPPAKVMEKATELLRTILANGPIAISMAKSAINGGADQTISIGFLIERDSFAQCFASEDQKEAMGAFVEKRDAKFKGK